MSIVEVTVMDRVAEVALNDPDRRNALGTAMFDALDAALRGLREGDASVILLHGRGRVLCAGFDLAAATEDPAIMGAFIERLGSLLRALRRAPQVVVASVHGAAIAGGCAVVSACDLVVVSASAKLGYPVHRLGLSPAVSIPTLVQAIGPGAARALMLGGELLEGRRAKTLGLAFAVSRDDESTLGDARALAREIAGHGPNALRVTKQWLNELDGSLDDRRHEGPAADTARLARTNEAQMALAAALASRGMDPKGQ